MEKFVVQRYVDGAWWTYGTYTSRDKANAVAMWLREMNDEIWVQVIEE